MVPSRLDGCRRATSCLTSCLGIGILVVVASYWIGWSYSLSLPGHLKLMKVEGNGFSISKGIDGVVGVYVREYAVLPNYVVGRTTKEDYTGESFFIIDTTSTGVREGLSRTEWLKALRANGITRTPHLHRPSPFDALLGYTDP